MPEQPPPDVPAPAEVQTTLHTIARLLRENPHLGPEEQRALADLVDELGHALHPATVPSEEMAHLAESTTHLVQALHQGHGAGLLSSARNRLEQAIIRAEAQAPVAAGVARRLLDTLANLGI